MEFVKNLQSFRQSCNESLINKARSFLYRPRCARSVLSRPQTDILPVRPSCLVNKKYLLCGRGKNHNLLLTGPTNCRKSFLLNPLKVIYQTFCNPTTGTFASVARSVVDVRRWCSPFALAKDPLFYWRLFAKRHCDLCHRERPRNLYQEWSNWPIRNWHDVLKVENFEAASLSSTWGTAGNTTLPKVLFKACCP